MTTPVRLHAIAMLVGWIAASASVTTLAELPRFDRVLLLEDAAAESANVSIGDLNGDRHLDIVLAKGRHSPLVDRVLLNDGHGRFPVARDLGAASDRSYSAPLVDLDGDGDLDVVISNDSPDPKLVYLNDGQGRFHVGSTWGRPEWPTRNASVADLNGDGLPDIVAANRTGDSRGSNYVCLNRGNGRFDADCLAFSHESATTIAPADFNRDGSIDLAVPHREGGQSFVYLNDGKAGFSRRVPFGLPDAAIRVVAAADLDGDRFIDIVAIDERRGTFIYFNQGGGAFSAGLPVGGGAVVPYALAAGDLNGDSRVDIVVGNVTAPSTVYFNDGSGRRFTPVPFGDGKGTVYGFAFGDLDEDGLQDIAVARSGAPNVVYFGGRPQGDAAAPLASGDFDGLVLGVDRSTGVVTGYFEDHTGFDSVTRQARFSCMFYLRGRIDGRSPYPIVTWFPGERDPKAVIDGTIDVAGAGGRAAVSIALKEEHGGCWNVRRFADKPAASFAQDGRGDWREIRVVSAPRARFHDAPRSTAARAAYVVKGNVLRVYESRGGWVRAEYRGARGAVTTGWIRTGDLFSALPPRR